MSENSQENTCVKVSFLIKLKTWGLSPASLLKKGLWHRCFPASFVKFLRTLVLIEHLLWLLQKILGEHYLLLELRSGEHEFYFSYLRMNPEKIGHLQSLVKDKITKENGKFRKGISAEERLVLTLSILATGMSKQSLSFAFRIGKSTVEKA